MILWAAVTSRSHCVRDASAVLQVHVPDVGIRSWRELIEFRYKELAKRTRVRNGIRGLLRVQGVMVPKHVRNPRLSADA